VVQIRLLGGVRASDDNGVAVDVGPAKCQAVLAALALRTGSVVSVSRIVEMVWGEDPPRTAEKTLQSYVTRLRKGLGAGSIVREGAAYRLNVDPRAVDVARFQRLLDTGDVEAALAEWSGRPMAGLDAAGLGPAVDGLVEQWIGAVEAGLAHHVDVDPARAIGPLTELAANHPYRESLCALLMTALYRVGRQADALAAYRTTRNQLVEELGVEPGPQLRELERKVLGHDEGLDSARPARATIGHGNLPRRSARLIGRDDDVRLVTEELTNAHVVTLVGPGGIGKTRLAVASAQAAEGYFEGGGWLVELARVSTSTDVARAVADALDVEESPGRTLTESIVIALQQHRALLILDNCEHVVDGAAQLAQALADGCPDLRVLATSRVPLGLGAERLVTVGPLGPGPGVELFVERAAAVDPTFDAHTGPGDVAEICRRLDGVPLAIELAAARARTMPPAELLPRLDQSLRLLTGAHRGGVEHHRTLRAAVQWSHDLLSAREQVLFRRLSRFVAPFDLLAAEAVAAGGELDAIDVDELLAGLVDQSMVLVERSPVGRRLRLLDSMRQLGAEYLTASGEDDSVAEQHARWCVEEVARIHQLLAGQAELDGAARLSELWPNLRAAVDWACVRHDAPLARSLVAPVAAEVHLRSQNEIADWAERILAIAPPDDHDLIVFGLALAARRYWRIQDRAGFERLCDQYGEPDNPIIHHARALVYQDFDALLRWCPLAAAEQRRAGHDLLAALADFGVGRALLALGRLQEGDELVSALAVRYRSQGPPTLLSWALTMLSYAAAAMGDRARANQLFDQAADVAVPDRTHVSTPPIEAAAAFRRGDRERAFQLLRSHAISLLESDNLYETSSSAVAFVDMMGRLELATEAARILGYLETNGVLEAALFRTDVAGAVALVADEDLEHERSLGRTLDHRQALTFISDVLERLTS
jgi:predicted ATPase/DNA-binding SARP family transcriptional activator